MTAARAEYFSKKILNSCNLFPPSGVLLSNRGNPDGADAVCAALNQKEVYTMKKSVALTMAALMSVSTGITAFAEDANKELESTLAMVKERVSVSSDISEFSYTVQKQGPVNVYSFNWNTPASALDYKYVSASAYGSVITSYHAYDGAKSDYTDSTALAKLSADQLYAKAKAAVKKLNPDIAQYISIDRDSLSMWLYSSNASFALVRTKNGVPVANDTGRISINKNTGELTSFYINWHPKAAFKSKSGALTEDEAWEKYAELIGIEPQYDIFYDWEKKEYTSRLVYAQSDSGEINAYTGERSNFAADSFYGDEDGVETCEEASDMEDGGKGNGFTPQELEEINKKLPYGSEEGVIKLIKSNKYLRFSDGMVLNYDYLYKDDSCSEPRYFYSASFSTDSPSDYWDEPELELTSDVPELYEGVSISVDAQTGEIQSYSYWSSDSATVETYDQKKADKKAAAIAKAFAPAYIDEFTIVDSWTNDYTTDVDKPIIYGSSHSFGRKVNDIRVNGDNINIELDADMKLTGYSLNYHDVEFASPEKMLSAQQVMTKFREDSTLDLYYLAKTGKKKTGTVLVYGCNDTVYADAFTGEPVYTWSEMQESDLSGITDPELLRKAQELEYNGVIITRKGEKQTDAVTQQEFADILSVFANNGLYRLRDNLTLPSGAVYKDDEQKLTRADAMVLYASAECGTAITELQGIFKNPFTDVDDGDKFLGCYAVAYALGAAEGSALNGSAPYTYASLIELVYNSLA